MKKIAYFACDIAGTFSTHLKDQELHVHLTKFAEQLEQIRKDSGADELIFSFFTADSEKNYLFRYINLLKPYINGTTIKLGYQFMNSGRYDIDGNQRSSFEWINKISEMKKDVKFLQRENEIVWLGYADDKINKDTIDNLIAAFPEISIIHGFVPSGNKELASDTISISSQNNLEGLISSLDNHINPTIIKPLENELSAKTGPTQSSIWIMSDNYDYLNRKGYKLNGDIISEEDLEFIVSIYKILDISGEIPDGTIKCLRKLKVKYEDACSISMFEADENLYFANYECHKCIDGLLSSLFYSGYMHKFSPNELDNILRKTSILALSLAESPEGYITHFPKPKNRFFRSCSFHTEKTQSLLLYEDTSSFSCFGCGQSGNIFQYLMHMENMSFINAVDTLARAFNVSLSKKIKTKERPDIIERILKALASDYYRQLLEESKARTIATYGEYPISYNIKPKKLELTLPKDYCALDDDNDENLPF